MKLTPELNDAFNQQILHEYKNMLAYKKIQCYFENLELKKLASYFKKQSDHEKDHADIFVDHLNNRIGGKVTFSDIASPNFEINELSDVGKIYVQIEEQTTNSIESIYDLSLSIKSFIDLSLVEQMLKEQIEEEDTALEFALKSQNVKDVVLFDATFE